MAQRRLISKQIAESDAFLDMSLSAQALYFHFILNADDDGFVDNPKKIMRMLGAMEDDFKILVLKRFILTFENGIIVIKHWLIHNTIRKDRYTPTKYMDEKKGLFIKENKAYTTDGNQLATNWQPNGNLSEVKLSKDNTLRDKHAEFNSLEYIKALLSNPRKDIHIIGLYSDFKGFNFPSKEAAESSLKRDLRPAGALTGYSDEQILKTMDYLAYKGVGGKKIKWTLETVGKYINEL